jgi:hypothetical protein
MSGKWFSNRGQMVQVGCAVIAVAIGTVTQWSQISNAVDLELILKIALYPLAAVLLVQLGKHFPVGRLDIQTAQPKPIPDEQPTSEQNPKSTIEYRFLTPSIKAGAYFDVGQEFGLRRVSLLSIKSKTLASQEVPVAELEVAGMSIYFTPGHSIEQLGDRKFLIPASQRDTKTESSSIFEFMYSKDSLTLTSVSVDHINVPGQEATVVICSIKYRQSR